MTIKDIKIKNSRIGVHGGGTHEVCQLVTMTIYYNEEGKEAKTIDLELRKKTSLKFFSEAYFITLSNKMLEIWDQEGNRIKIIPKLKGKIIGGYNDWFLTLQKNSVEAYNKFGIKVAEGELTENKSVDLQIISQDD
jgi:hypothetical protein